jgi:hypothetical protein
MRYFFFSAKVPSTVELGVHMKTFIALLLVCVFPVTNSAAAVDDGAPDQATATHDAHHGSHDVQANAAPRLRAGERWPTDEPLRAGMSRIEDAVAHASAAGRPISAKSAREVAQTVEQNVTYIVQHCKLEPDADAALHGIIGQMMSATTQLKKEDASRDTGVTQLNDALATYRNIFDQSAAHADE